MSCAPYALISSRRSLLILSGMIITVLICRIAPTIARAIPVLPLVASTMMLSSWMRPCSLAACNIPRTARSFTEPPTLYFSSFT